jgi:hypothetical protein
LWQVALVELGSLRSASRIALLPDLIVPQNAGTSLDNDEQNCVDIGRNTHIDEQSCPAVEAEKRLGGGCEWKLSSFRQFSERGHSFVGL